MEEKPTIYVVDDEQAVRASLRRLIRSVGMQVETYPTAREFLDRFDPDRPGCIVLDVRMPGMSGLELQGQLVRQGIQTPIILISAHGDVPMAVKAMRAGALDFIEKPFRSQVLLDLIWRGLEQDQSNRRRRHEREALQRRLDQLTQRERQVVGLVASGLTTARIARRLKLSPKTVLAHRAEAMGKLGVESIAALARLMLGSTLPPAPLAGEGRGGAPPVRPSRSGRPGSSPSP